MAHQIEWEEFKPILRRAYFGDNGIFVKDSELFNDFWVFFKKYLAISAKKEAEPSSSSGCNRQKRQVTKFRLDKTERYMLRDVPKQVVEEFEYILHSFLTFCQRQKFTKLKKLRQSQMNLPVAHYRQKILDTIKANNVVVIAGDTGCGKSTQIPQYLLAAGYDKIACTQPRRIACISLAKRVAFETLNEYGSHVAYQIRFERTKTQATKLLFLTEGLLLRQLGTDATLSSYNVIILDEIHERHIHGDFLMGILKSTVTERKDLKVILMSATINIDLFSKYFHDAPVIQVPGRLYPIRLDYRPPPVEREPKKSERIDPGPYLRVLQLIDHKFKSSERGDMLVFLSGITEISTVAECLQKYAEQTKNWIILNLHSTLSLEEQDKVFDIAPEGVRKCILSTNIAETSVTIDGVRFVVDSGKVKEMTYEPETKMHRLKETWVSQASAEQRKGRAGRTGPGHCFRLYSAEDYEKLDKYSASEIHRVSLESLVLQMIHLGLPNPRKFDFIEPPPPEALEHAIDYLIDQTALTSGELLTPLGRMLVNLPVDVGIGKMLIMGCLFRQVEVVLTIAAALSVQSPFTNRSYRDSDCITLRQSLMSDQGDPFALLNTYRDWLQLKASGAESTRRWCQKRGIEESRLYDISKLRAQFRELLEDGELIEKQDVMLSAVDRRMRQGEVKRLRELKRKCQNVQRKRKVLKIDSLDFVHADEEPDDRSDETNVSSVDFDMKYTSADIREHLQHYRLDFSSVYLVKMIICSALYPQFGILDPHNCCKVGADQMLHSKAKPFLVLHPNSCLASAPDALQVQTDSDGQSTIHQIVFYSMLLETTKPYVVNSVRVPALHTLLLFARSIDTNRDCSRIVFDQWVEFELKDAGQAQDLLFRALDLRQMMAQSLERKLNGEHYRSDELAGRLTKYLLTETLFRLQRLMKVDQHSLYVGAGLGVGIADLPPSVTQRFESILKLDEQKGGVALTDYLTYGCLKEKGESAASTEHYLTRHWVCANCGQQFWFTPLERLAHLDECKVKNEQSTEEGTSAVSAESTPQATNPLQRGYFCDVCNKQFMFTATEILKHKKSHR